MRKFINVLIMCALGMAIAQTGLAAKDKKVKGKNIVTLDLSSAKLPIQPNNKRGKKR